MGNAELQQQAIALIEQLSTEELKWLLSYSRIFRIDKHRTKAHPVDPDVEIAIKEIFKKYERAWKLWLKCKEAVTSGRRGTNSEFRCPSTRI